MKYNICIIGGGNLGVAIAQGLIKIGFALPSDIIITKRKVESLINLQALGVAISSNNVEAVAQSKYIFLAVKPYQVQGILQELSNVLIPEMHTIISVVTGVFIKDITEILGANLPILRAMPNTAIAIAQSMTCLAHKNLKDTDLQYLVSLFNHLGKTVIIEENLMDAATVLGACGTAYAMRFIRANIQGGIEIGFDAKTAALIAAQTSLGAAELLLTNNTHPEQEIDKVTTPKGCTIAGLNEMEHKGFSSSLIKGITTSYAKIKNM
jgi:pyrroline-5-carboxylate reductase